MRTNPKTYQRLARKALEDLQQIGDKTSDHYKRIEKKMKKYVSKAALPKPELKK